MLLGNNLIDPIASAAAWAWSSSLFVLPIMVLLLLLGRWRSFPASWRLALAAVVGIRLLLPMVPSVSWHPWQSAKSNIEGESIELASISSASVGAWIHGASLDPPETIMIAAPVAWSSLLSAIWLSGTIVTSVWAVGSHLRLRSLIQQQARPASEAVRSTLTWSRQRMGVRQALPISQITGLPTMAIWGWLAPRLLVPHDATERYTQAELRGMLLHELVHLRRRDGMWIWLALAACAMHWFNPLVWLCLRRYLADRELECDREALKLLPETERLTYGHALLKTLAGQRAWPLATCTPFSRPLPNHELHYRITMIAQPLNSRWGRFAALLTVPVLAIGTLTTAADEDGKKPTREEGRREGDGDGDGSRKTGPRDGEGTRTEPRDGETRKDGARDGEAMKRRESDGTERGARGGDGEGRKSAERDGGARKSAESEGAFRKYAESESDERRRDGGRRASQTRVAAIGEQMVITVNAEGNVVNSKGEVIDIKMVRGRMKNIADSNPDQSVILRAAADTPYAKVLNVLDALKDSGLKDVKME